MFINLLTFPAFRMGAYSGWALIRGLAFVRINTVPRITSKNYLSELPRTKRAELLQA